MNPPPPVESVYQVLDTGGSIYYLLSTPLLYTIISGRVHKGNLSMQIFHTYLSHFQELFPDFVLGYTLSRRLAKHKKIVDLHHIPCFLPKL